jgi:hypothetical protein
MRRTLLIATAFGGILPFTLVAADGGSEGDSSAGLPKEYEQYLIAGSTLSPDKTIGVIYPKLELCNEESEKRCKDFLVSLKPFKILGTLETKSPHFQNRNHGDISGEWSKDGTAALITLESKWGPGDIFLFEFKDGALTRSTNLLRKMRDLLEPDYRKATSVRVSDEFDFIFVNGDSPMVAFKDSSVQIDATATTDPKEIPGQKAWDGKLDAVWDIPGARFSSQKVKRLFAGVRKEE